MHRPPFIELSPLPDEDFEGRNLILIMFTCSCSADAQDETTYSDARVSRDEQEDEEDDSLIH